MWILVVYLKRNLYIFRESYFGVIGALYIYARTLYRLECFDGIFELKYSTKCHKVLFQSKNYTMSEDGRDHKLKQTFSKNFTFDSNYEKVIQNYVYLSTSYLFFSVM